MRAARLFRFRARGVVPEGQRLMKRCPSCGAVLGSLLTPTCPRCGHAPGSAPNVFNLGLDLGKRQDFTALAGLQVLRDQEGQPAHYLCGHLERWRDVDYLDIVAQLRRFCAGPPLAGASIHLAVDATCVGDAVV